MEIPANGNGNGRVSTPLTLEKPEAIETPKIVESIVKSSEPEKSVLGELPKFSAEILSDKEFFLKEQLTRRKRIFFGALALVIAVYAYFTYELSSALHFLTPYLGETVSQTLTLKQEQSRVLAEKIASEAKELALREFNVFVYRGNLFLSHLKEPAPADTLNDLEKILAQDEKELKTLLTQIKHSLMRIPEDRRAELRVIAASLEKTDPETLARETLKETTQKLLRASPGPLAHASAIIAERAAWNTLIKEIDVVTSRVDESYQTGLFEEFGGISYRAYDFTKETGRITLSGVSKQYDARNFSELADLVDEMESSPRFKDVEMRSFAKSGDAKEGFLANFKIDLSIQTDERDPRDRSKDITDLPT